MSVLSNFEGKVEGAVDGAAAAMFSSPIEPAQIAKKAEKQMKKEKLVGSGRQYAPTLYNVLVNAHDDRRLFGFYPTMAAEIENYLYAKGTEAGMEFDTRPLVRFIPDPGLKKSRFDVIAEVISAPIIVKLRAEEMEYYGLAPKGSANAGGGADNAARASSGASNRASRNVSRYDREAGRPASVQNPARSQYSDSPPYSARSSERFAGLDRPARISDSLDSLDLPPLSQEREVLDRLPGLGAGAAANSLGAAELAQKIPSPAAQIGRDGRQISVPSLSSQAEDAGVIGRAALYNTFERQSYPLKHRKLTAGRGRENEIIVADANASRINTRFSQDATGKWKITDLNSTNGTLLNGRPVSSAILRHGDEITIGTTVLQFRE